jgi:hypothetical protein
VAQLVAHLHGMQGVRGSSPLRSTNDSPRLRGVFRYLDNLSSSGQTTRDFHGVLRDAKVLGQNANQGRIRLPSFRICSQCHHQPLRRFSDTVHGLTRFHKHWVFHSSNLME